MECLKNIAPSRTSFSQSAGPITLIWWPRLNSHVKISVSIPALADLTTGVGDGAAVAVGTGVLVGTGVHVGAGVGVRAVVDVGSEVAVGMTAAVGT